MTDRQLATRWDADQRLAATVCFVAGVAVIVGAALWLSVGMLPAAAIVQGEGAGAFEVTLAAGLLLLTDVALLVFVVGLVHALAPGGSFGRAVASAVATLATTVSATLHLLWGHVGATPEVELPVGLVQFATWLAVNLWVLPLYGLLVGATLLAVSLALRASEFAFARRLGTVSAALGSILGVLSPLSGFEPDQLALVAVATIGVATIGVLGLLLVALVRLGVLLRQTRVRS